MLKYVKTMLIIYLLSVINIYADKPELRVVYFQTADADSIDIGFHDELIKSIQSHYQNEMTRHGYTNHTFPFELDRNNKVKINIVKTDNRSSKYNKHITAYNLYMKNIKDEIPMEFRDRSNVLLILLGGVAAPQWNGNIGMGFTRLGGDSGGVAMVKTDIMNTHPNHYLSLITHELGHAFGLDPGHNHVPESLNGHFQAFGKSVEDWGDKMSLLKSEADRLKDKGLFRVVDTDDSITDNSADINQDGYVDVKDIKIVRDAMKYPNRYNADVNNDGKVDQADIDAVKIKAMEAIVAAAPSLTKRKKITTWGSLKRY
ncbi:hypothetical protein F4X88_03600 [Candidatus Poribacteria bacterium]|nr:hypothetical protein [Candidatus Poribacteria bacterium]